MIRINLVARIAGDKNSFLDLVYVAHKLKQSNIEDFMITFIGVIDNVSIYQNITRMAELLGVANKIDFTRKSIPMANLPDDIKNGYFFNFTVGSFMGYSSVDSINLGFKTIFCNADNRLKNELYPYCNVCPDLNSAINFITLIHEDAAAVDKQIVVNNQLMKASFLLNTYEASLLRSLMKPGE
ncbi:hypothetical protein [Mucilaginibacter sp. R-33]|uniref:hypothetical protein n=1 Tax=Mucilaginibacter sp. R-33 TaxID=3416711 RepID=UPI003CFA7876